MRRTSAPGNLSGLFTDGDPATGLQSTVLDAAWCNTVQEELVAVVEAAGLSLNPSDNNQVLDALTALYRNGRLLGLRSFFNPGTVTYTPTVGTRFVVVEAQGGGGGGAGAPATASSSGYSVGTPGAGGAGGLAIFIADFAGVTITVGAAGGAGVVGANGGNGGDSSFGTLLVCPGGAGGTAGSPATTPISGGQSNLAVPTGANLRPWRGDGGTPSFVFSGSCGFGGAGGASLYGGGGQHSTVNQAGQAAVARGSGGGGTAAFNNTNGLAGSVGAPGQLIVWEYS